MRSTALTLAVVAFALLAPSTSQAHPSTSVVMDARGNVFYSDLSRVMMIAPDGRRQIAVPNVHAHELYLDSHGNLYGDHVWYEGRRTKKWGHRVWKRAPDGTITDVIPASEGSLTDYGFTRDSTGTMYWAHGEPRTEIRKRRNGAPVVVHSGRFRDVRSIVAGPDGTVYVIDSADLKKILPDGKVLIVSPGIASRSLARINVNRRHAVMGLWLDSQNNLYAASYGTGEVKRVSPSGEVSVISRSRLPWSPTGGMVAPNGDLWILETSLINEVRLKRIASNGSTSFY